MIKPIVKPLISDENSVEEKKNIKSNAFSRIMDTSKSNPGVPGSVLKNGVMSFPVVKELKSYDKNKFENPEEIAEVKSSDVAISEEDKQKRLLKNLDKPYRDYSGLK